MNMNETRARDEICRIGQSLFSRGYVHATAGNISIRLDDGYLITPSDACLGHLDPARLAKVNAQGVQVSGDKASKTLVLHQHIYQAAQFFNDTAATEIHTHSTHCVALSLRQPTAGIADTPSTTQPSHWPELLPPLTPYFVMKVGHVPHLSYRRPGDALTASWVAQAIAHYGQQGAPIRAVMLERLGPNVWHQDPASAMAVLEELEETARLALLCPEVSPLASKHIQELRETFGARWLLSTN